MNQKFSPGSTPPHSELKNVRGERRGGGGVGAAILDNRTGFPAHCLATRGEKRKVIAGTNAPIEAARLIIISDSSYSIYVMDKNCRERSLALQPVSL